MRQFCRNAVRKTLLMSSVTGLVGTIDGCHRAPKAGPAPSRAAAPEARELPVQAAVVDAAVADAAVMTMAPKPPVLRANRRELASTEAFRTFSCVEPPETPEAHAAAVELEGVRHYERDIERDARAWDHVARTFTLDVDYDFVEVVRVVGPGQVGMEGDSLRPVPYALARAGTPCSGASDMAGCEAALKSARESVFADVPCEAAVCSEYDLTYALTTRGDTVAVRRKQAELVALFAGVDTASEAWMMLAFDKGAFHLQCENPIYARQRSVHGGFELATRRYTSSCQPILEEDLVYRVDARGKVRLVHRKDVSRDPLGCVVSGRRPQALTVPRAEQDTVGELFARMAYLERASVTAFARMHEELRALGAPSQLLARVERAGVDEVRHAHVMAAWASRHEQRESALRIAPMQARTAAEIARENAVEGCVRELFGALVVRFQAARASDPSLREDLARIAEDEAAHAALAFDVAAWLEPRLALHERLELEGAITAALHELEAELVEPGAGQREQGGLPSLAESRALLAQVVGGVHALRGPYRA
jgi:hypothetical protein